MRMQIDSWRALVTPTFFSHTSVARVAAGLVPTQHVAYDEAQGRAEAEAELARAAANILSRLGLCSAHA